MSRIRGPQSRELPSQQNNTNAVSTDTMSRTYLGRQGYNKYNSLASQIGYDLLYGYDLLLIRKLAITPTMYSANIKFVVSQPTVFKTSVI